MKIPFPPLSKINKTWVVLGAALTIGLLAAVATRSFLSTRVAEIEARNVHQTLSVVVAKMDLAQNTILSSDNAAVRKIPVEYAHSGAVQPGDFERVAGNAIAFPVKAGEMILWSQMAGKRVPTFSARLAAGRRAITVVVDEINSISGMLEPGDLIDLMLTIDQNGRKVVLPLLQSMQVMATGQRSVDDAKNGEAAQFSTVTLDTTPAQARNLIIARENGKLTALLRNPADKAAPGLQDYDLSLLFDARPESIPLPQRRGIPVLYGGSGMPVPADALRLQGHRSGTDPPMPVPMPPAPVAAPPPTVLINAAAAPP